MNLQHGFKSFNVGKGLLPEFEYYEWSSEESACEINFTSGPGVSSVGFSTIDVGSEEDLAAAVAVVGPIAVGVDASKSTFHFYSEGRDVFVFSGI